MKPASGAFNWGGLSTTAPCPDVDQRIIREVWVSPARPTLVPQPSPVREAPARTRVRR